MASARFIRHCFSPNVFRHFIRSPRFSSVGCHRRKIFTSVRVLGTPGQPIDMPALSPTMEEGRIVQWLKKEGDAIQPGDALCEVETDKATVTMEIEEEGILAKIMVPDGTANVRIGTVIALMVEEGQDYKDVEIPAAAGTTAAAPEPAPAAPGPSTAAPAPTGGDVPGMQVPMPSLSPTMEEGRIVAWLKKEGDKVEPGDALCEIETDKATVTMEIEEEGILAKILVPEGTANVPIGKLIALLVDEGADFTQVQIPPEAATPSTPPSGGSPVPETSALGKASGILSPAVRTLLEQHDINPAAVIGRGPHGRILKGDVLHALRGEKSLIRPGTPFHMSEVTTTPVDQLKTEVPTPQPTPPSSKPKPVKPIAAIPDAEFTDIEVTSMRKTIAKRLTESKFFTPHFYATIDCRMEEVLKLRKQLKEDNVKVSVNDFLIKAIATALKEVPELNAVWNGESAQLLEDIDISVAVATPTGLITPIVKGAAQKGLAEIASVVKDLAGRAREGKLKLNEFQGGSFTISNLGMFGIQDFTAIINPPQAAILAIGRSRLVLNDDNKPETLMSVTLCSDQRVVESDSASQFLDAFRKNIENPFRMACL
ncbi:pyruvate dehydrogenase protein X component-like [Glandiceps talaboti]